MGNLALVSKINTDKKSQEQLRTNSNRTDNSYHTSNSAPKVAAEATAVVVDFSRNITSF